MTGLGLHPHDYMIVYILIQSPISHLWFQTKFPRSHYSNVTWCHVTNYRQIDCFGFNRLATTTASLFHITVHSWWRDQMETFSALLARCPGNSPVTREFPAQRPVTRSFDVFFDLRPNKRLSKQSSGWWFETPSCSLWRHCNVMMPESLKYLWGPFPNRQ